MSDQLQLAVNHALNDLRMARARMGMLNPSMGLDAKRNAAWCEYGFKQDLEFQDFFNLYKRGGIAHGAVEALVSNCWKTDPWVIEGDDADRADRGTRWEGSLADTAKRAQLWRALSVADRYRLVGRYSGLILHIRDGRTWREPAIKGRGLERVTPAWAGSLLPVDFDTNENRETYGQPGRWQYSEQLPNGSSRKVFIHPDRVFIFGDWSSGAIGFLEPAYNAFVSLEKVEGGSGESFLKNAARQMAVSFDKEVNLRDIASMYGVGIDELHKKFNDAARDVNTANDMLMILQGASVSPLVASVPDPTPTYNINLQTAAAALDIPTRILVGNQTGERASTEDRAYFNSRCQGRRGDLGFEIHDFLRHLMGLRIIDTVPEFTVMWGDLNEPTRADKLAAAKTMSEINAVSLATGVPVFESNEIREAAGFEPENIDPLPDDDDE